MPRSLFQKIKIMKYKLGQKVKVTTEKECFTGKVTMIEKVKNVFTGEVRENIVVRADDDNKQYRTPEHMISKL